MTKRVMAFVILVVCVMSLSMSVSASTGKSLDDIVNDNQNNSQSSAASSAASSSTGEARKPTDPKSDASAISGLYGASDLSEPVAGVAEATSMVQRIAAGIVQALAYLITVGLGVSVLLDLTFIALPFTRKFLSNGFTGQMQNQSPQQANMSMGGGYGAGGMYGGGGGMHGGGMYGGGMGGGMYGGGMNQMQAGQQQAQMNSFRIQFVSGHALDAVANENAVDPVSGKSTNPFKIYFKEKIITFISVGVLMILAMTGALMRVSLLLGQWVASMVDNISITF